MSESAEGPGNQCNVYRDLDGLIWWGPWFEGCTLVASCSLWEAARAAARLLSTGEEWLP